MAEKLVEESLSAGLSVAEFPRQRDIHPVAANCHGKSVSELAQTFGKMPNAASALGYWSVQDLQDGMSAFCGN